MGNTVKLYNRGKRTITGFHSDVIDETTGKPKKYAFLKESAAEFQKADAAKLRRLFPAEIVSMEDVKRQFDEKPVALEAPDSIPRAQAEQEKADAIAQAIQAERDRATAEAIAAGDPAAQKTEAGEADDFQAKNTIAKMLGKKPKNT